MGRALAADRPADWEAFFVRARATVSDTGTASSGGVVRRVVRKRPPMSAVKFRAVLQMLGWSQTRMHREIGVSLRSISYYKSGELPVPRVVELALMFCLVRDKPAQLKENSELLARLP